MECVIDLNRMRMKCQLNLGQRLRQEQSLKIGGIRLGNFGYLVDCCCCCCCDLLVLEP